MNIFNKLPTDIKCLIIDKVSQDNHKDLMKQLTTCKDIDRCEFCNNALIISLDIRNQLQSLYYEVEEDYWELDDIFPGKYPSKLICCDCVEAKLFN